MTWIVLIICSAITLGVYDVCKKHAVDGNAVMPVLFWGTCSGTAAVMLALATTGQLAPAADISWRVFQLLFLKSLIVAASWTCAYYAMRALPISIAAPIRGSQPVWTLAGALLLFAERPAGWQWAGIAVTLTGYYAFAVVGRREGIVFRRHAGIALIVLATALGAASALYDKYLLQPRGLTPQTVQLWFQIDLVGILGAVWLAQRAGGLGRTRFAWRWTIPAIGLALVISDFLYFSALHEPGAKISILSPIRRSNCVISFLVGGALFQEQNRRAKAVALGMIVLGVALLCISGG